MIRAVTFDFWDTIASDDSDEPKRAARGLRTKSDERLALLVAEIRSEHPDVPEARIEDAWAHATHKFEHWWKVEHHTPPVSKRLAEALVFLGLTPTRTFGQLVEAFEQMEVVLPPDPVAHIEACLEALRTRYRLGIISDAIVTPGRGIRAILRGYGLLRYFDVFIFSDEVGASKPSRQVFQVAARELGVELGELVHIGDRESNDIAGPHAAGARAILYTGAVDRGSADTAADAVCSSYEDLPRILASLDA